MAHVLHLQRFTICQLVEILQVPLPLIQLNPQSQGHLPLPQAQVLLPVGADRSSAASGSRSNGQTGNGDNTARQVPAPSARAVVVKQECSTSKAAPRVGSHFEPEPAAGQLAQATKPVQAPGRHGFQGLGGRKQASVIYGVTLSCES